MRNPVRSLASLDAGFGLGLRTAHYGDFVRERQPLDWLEIISDNYLVEGGKPLQVLDRLRQDYPMAMHGVALSLGAASGIDPQYVARLKALAERIDPLWVSDHLCWTGHGPEQLHDLYPLPYTDEAARHVITQIRRTQDLLQRRLVVENVSSYLSFRQSAASEWQFLAHIAEEADCLLLVDVNNVHVSSVNHGFDAMAYLRGLPPHRVQQIHLAGHSIADGHLIDTHDHPVADAVWALYAEACALYGQVPTMIERDADIPPLPALLGELAHARELAQASLTLRALPGAACTPPTWRPEPMPVGGHAASLSELQRQFAAAILSETDPESPASARAVRRCFHGAQAPVRLAIYHNAYRSRLAEVLADSFPRTCAYMGGDAFAAQARAFAVEQPPRQRSLSRYGDMFPAHLAARFPHNPELHELAQLDWDLRSRFDGPDWPALDAETARTDSTSSWLQRPAPLHPSLTLRQVRTNVVQIWKALDADEEVPAVCLHAAPLTLLAWRKALQPRFQTLDEAQACFVRALADGASIEQACADFAQSPALQDPQQLGRWLRHWLDEGLLSA